MKRFLDKDNKLNIPENEIDNIYVWTRVSKTQELLLNSSSYFKLIQHSFEQDTKRVISVLKQNIPSLSYDSYKLNDYITFMANKDKIFNDKTCFVYMTSMDMLTSLACFLAHTENLYKPKDDALSSLIINYIDEKERFVEFMEADFLILRVYSTLPEHKYRSSLLETMLSRRSMQGKYTLIFTQNSSMLIGDNLINKNQAKDKRLIDLSPLVQSFNNRRHADYRQLLKLWYGMSSNTSCFVYSTTKPKITLRQVDKNNEQ